MDWVLIEELECRARVGVSEEERRTRQRVLIDLELGLDLRRAGRRDRVDETVDYAAVAQAARRFAEQGSFRLVESVAEKAAGLLLERFPVKEVRVRVRKLSVPGARSVGVAIRRGRPCVKGARSSRPLQGE